MKTTTRMNGDGPRRATGRGFTLVEAIATISIIALISVGATQAIWSATNLNTEAMVRSRMISDMNMAMERLVQDVRMVSRVTGPPVTPGLTSASTASWTFTVQGTTMVLTYSNVGQTLTYGPSGSATVILRNVSAFSMPALDRTGTVLSMPLDAAGIAAARGARITMTCSMGGVSETLRTQVYFRSMQTGSGAP